MAKAKEAAAAAQNQKNEIPSILKGVSPEHLDVAKAMIAGKKFQMETPAGIVECQLVERPEDSIIFDQGKDVEYGQFNIVSTNNQGLSGNVKAFQSTTFRVWTNDIIGNLARTRVKFEAISVG